MDFASHTATAMMLLLVFKCLLSSGTCLPVLDEMTLIPTITVKSLEVILDASLSIESQVMALAKSAFYHLRLVPFVVV